MEQIISRTYTPKSSSQSDRQERLWCFLWALDQADRSLSAWTHLETTAPGLHLQTGLLAGRGALDPLLHTRETQRVQSAHMRTTSLWSKECTALSYRRPMDGTERQRWKKAKRPARGKERAAGRRRKKREAKKRKNRTLSSYTHFWGIWKSVLRKFWMINERYI